MIRTLGISPSDILVLTFSRAAAEEMRQRFFKSCSAPVLFGTFHSVFYSILREEASCPPRILKPSEVQSLLSATAAEYLPQLHYEDPRYLEYFQKKLLFFREKLPQYRHNPEMTAEDLLQKQYFKAADYYETFLAENDLADYEEMALRCRSLFLSNEEILYKWQNRFRAVLIDEFQDINPLQYELICLLAGNPQKGRTQLFAVGDDDQCIYSFRNASPLIFQRFLQEHPDAEKILLNTNFRCSEKILKASLKIIADNRMRIPKKLLCGKKETGTVSLRSFANQEEEADFILHFLKDLPEAEQKSSAILFRSHELAEQFVKNTEKLLTASPKNTGEKAPGSDPLRLTDVEQLILRDLCGYFSLAVQFSGRTHKQTALLRILNRPPRYLKRDIVPEAEMTGQELLEHSVRSGRPFFKAWNQLLKDLKLLSVLKPPYAMKYLLESMHYRRFAEGAVRKEQQEKVRIFLDRLLELSADFERLSDFYLFLEKKYHNAGSAVGSKEADKILGARIMTMHASKGLEFKRVFLPDLNQEIIPGKQRFASAEQLEEERRLLYVAMTRAESELYLSYVVGSGQYKMHPSEFLAPIMNEQKNFLFKSV